MVLDLTVFNQETFDIKFSETETLHIKKADEELAIKLVAYSMDSADTDIKDVINNVNILIKEILNHNTDNKKFTKADIDKMQFNVKIEILRQYTEFIYNIQNNPN
ncbi:hypothetical protein SAMN02745248_00579 [Hathewaya proteolytica DSM 3090]|uniref:Uncharacterized protein n=1 Tax=Hathewaya proteolytica DSM 3090 TaxID=1121331 RepID=A0A1M6L0Q9_9CLOT|nr:hypothetical protein [Hathewaya proteolytica]SHJ64788.1 hypothetical protein SAMN02745248_00579 [Hathewaya proteolytica DSM 3090]